MPLGLFVFIIFLGGHLPQTSGFCSAKQILIVSSDTQVRARTLSDRDIFCSLGEGQQWRGLMPLGLFLLILRHLALTCKDIKPRLGSYISSCSA